MANHQSRFRHLLARILAVGFITILVLFVFQLQSSNAEINQVGWVETARALPYQLTPTPVFPLPTLPPEEYERFGAMTVAFSHPAARPTPASPPTFQALLSSPGDFEGYHLEVQGKIVQISQVQNLSYQDWSLAYVLVLDDGTAWLPVLYRGSVKGLFVGVNVTASGAFSAASSALNGDVVQAVTQPVKWLEQIPLELILAAAAGVILGFLLFILWIIPIKVKPAAATLLILLSLTSLAGCEFRNETTIHADGRVETSTHLAETQENTQFLRQIPGVERYLKMWLAELRDQGLLVENWQEGYLEHWLLKEEYADLASFSTYQKGTLLADSWVYATDFQSGGKQCYRYMASISPQVLREMPPNVDSNAAGEINRYFNSMLFTFSVKLPGKIVYTNAPTVLGSAAEWTIDTQRTNQLVAESCLPGVTLAPLLQWGWLAVAGVFVMDLGLLILVIQRFVRRKNLAKTLATAQ